MKSEPVVRFGAFADAHYADKVYGDRHCHDSADKLQACVEVFRNEGVDFAVCMGDLIDSAEELEVEIGYARTMSDIFTRFEGPRHWVLGNHDVSALTKEEFLELCGAERPAYYSFDVNGVHFVVLDGNFHEDGSEFRAGDFSWDDAWVCAAQTEWLARDLAEAGDRRAVILCHENIDHRLWNGVLDPHVVRDAARVRQVLEEAGNVTAVVQAHYHPGMQTVQNGIPYVCLRAMVVGAGMENTAYAIVEVHEDGRLVVEGRGQQFSYGEGGG